SDMPITDVVAAVSGGPDSVALRRALHDVVPGQIVVAHVNHGWRGRASDEDEAFVRDLAARLSGDTPRVSFKLYRAEPGEGPGNREAQARRLRYDWLTRVAQACGITWVTTG